jgi:hypothetical protein
MQQSNRKLLAAQGHNNYSLASSTDVPLEEDSKGEPSDNSNANNNNANHSFVLTIFTTKEEDNRVTPHAPSTTPQTHHGPITTFPCQLQSTWIEPAHQHGVVEDVDEDLPEDKPPKPLNQDMFPLEQDRQTSHTLSATNVAKLATTPEIAPQGHPLGERQRI